MAVSASPIDAAAGRMWPASEIRASEWASSPMATSAAMKARISARAHRSTPPAAESARGSAPACACGDIRLRGLAVRPPGGRPRLGLGRAVRLSRLGRLLGLPGALLLGGLHVGAQRFDQVGDLAATRSCRLGPGHFAACRLGGHDFLYRRPVLVGEL